MFIPPVIKYHLSWETTYSSGRFIQVSLWYSVISRSRCRFYAYHLCLFECYRRCVIHIYLCDTILRQYLLRECGLLIRRSSITLILSPYIFYLQQLPLIRFSIIVMVIGTCVWCFNIINYIHSLCKHVCWLPVKLISSKIVHTFADNYHIIGVISGLAYVCILCGLMWWTVSPKSLL